MTTTPSTNLPEENNEPVMPDYGEPTPPSFAKIKERIMTKYQSLSTRAEKLEFLYEVQERLRTVHNNRGTKFRNGEITENEFRTFQKKINEVNQRVSEKIASIRERVYVEDYGLAKPADEKDDVATEARVQKKEAIKAGVIYKNDIDTIWQ